jgi:transposase
MQGRYVYVEEQVVTIDLQATIPSDHLVRRMARVADFSFIYELTHDLYCEDNGRPSVDPVLFFRMQLIGHLFGITSDRRLCEEVQLNLAYRWFCQVRCAKDVPDHSSLTRIRDRFGAERYQAIFDRLLQQLRAKGIVRGRRVMVDATLVEADASINSLEERPQSDPQARALKMYEQRYHDFKEGKKRRQVSNQTHVSASDPDATLVSRPGTYRKLYYKVHYTIDSESRVILDCHLTTGAQHECTVMPERLAHLLEQGQWPIEEMAADKAYGRGPTYALLRQHGIRAYIPLHIEHLGEGQLSRRDFIYDRKGDRYRCPQNHYLYPYEKLDHRLIKRYRMLGGHCRQCPIRLSCLPKKHRHRARFVYRSPHQDEIDRIKKRQATPHFKRKLAERQWKAEGVFGEAKGHHGLWRAKYRGHDKMQIQLYLTAITQNLKRLVGRCCDLLWLVGDWIFTPPVPSGHFPCSCDLQ